MLRQNAVVSNQDRGQAEVPVASLDEAVAELVRGGVVEGWVAMRVQSLRNLFLRKLTGCWLLFTWSDGSVEIEEDYPPFHLVPELLSGTFRDEDRHCDYEIRWSGGQHRQELWARYGIHESPGYYMVVAAEQQRRRR
jgi:hypothetical protein